MADQPKLQLPLPALVVVVVVVLVVVVVEDAISVTKDLLCYKVFPWVCSCLRCLEF